MTTVTPFQVSGEINYDRLVTDFGCTRISPELLTRFTQVTGHTPHRFLRRGIFFSHRDLDVILDRVEAGLPVYIYTGRGPSSGSLHLGHLVPFVFTKWLQDVLKAVVVIQITDDEKFMWKGLSEQDCDRFAESNIKDIAAVGFDPARTFIFRDFNYVGNMYRVVCQIQSHLTVNQAKGIFGFTDSDHCGKFAFPAVQAAPAACTAFPHLFGGRKDVPGLIPCAIDQDPYFRMSRDILPRLGLPKCAVIHSKFFPGLSGDGKMSSSEGATVFLTDSKASIRSKVGRGFSGGRDTVEEHRRLGANLEVDVSIRYLEFFLEDDDLLARIKADYQAGRILSG